MNSAFTFPAVRDVRCRRDPDPTRAEFTSGPMPAGVAQGIHRATTNRYADVALSPNSRQMHEHREDTAKSGDDRGQAEEGSPPERQGTVAEVQDTQADGGSRQDNCHVAEVPSGLP